MKLVWDKAWKKHALVIAIALTYITRNVALYFSALQYIFILYLIPLCTDREREREGGEEERKNCWNFNKARQYDSFRLYWWLFIIYYILFIIYYYGKIFRRHLSMFFLRIVKVQNSSNKLYNLCTFLLCICYIRF